MPAYFGVAEKEATSAAARIAGLDCVELLAEPVAAAYAYGADPAAAESSLVFDLGGGTFDVAVVGVANSSPKIWAVDGETQLGGLDWDRRLNDLVWQRLVAKGIDEDAICDESLAASLSSEVELLKRGLSVHESSTARIRHGGTIFSTNVTRAAFEDATADLVTQCISAAKRVVSTSHAMGSSTVSRVLLVGGSTRMPMIRSALEKDLALPTFAHDPDKAVARGAAVLAEKLAQAGGISQGLSSKLATVRRITPVLPKAIGIKINSSILPARPEPYILNILSANTPLPIAAKQITVGTIVPNQSTARIELFEQTGSVQSEDLDSNRLLFDGEVTGIAPAPPGSPINLSLDVGIDGRIQVEASEANSGEKLNLDAFIHGVIDEQELDQQMSNVSNLLMAT